jgi:hypothetical protein
VLLLACTAGQFDNDEVCMATVNDLSQVVEQRRLSATQRE